MYSLKTTPYLSIIIPAHNEEYRLPATISNISTFLKTQPFDSEILLVDNASSDNTYNLAMGMQKQIDNLIVLQEPIKGKGQAVKRGMLATKGAYRMVCDADLTNPETMIPQLMQPLMTGCDIAIGSREAMGAKRYNEPLYRHLAGRIFNFLVRCLILPNLHDTQCGFKCFNGEIVESLFTRQTMTGWAFDVELLVIARQFGYSICEVPIYWYYEPHSHIKLFGDAINMFKDVLKIRANFRNGFYK